MKTQIKDDFLLFLSRLSSINSIRVWIIELESIQLYLNLNFNLNLNLKRGNMDEIKIYQNIYSKVLLIQNVHFVHFRIRCPTISFHSNDSNCSTGNSAVKKKKSIAFIRWSKHTAKIQNIRRKGLEHFILLKCEFNSWGAYLLNWN